MVDGRSTESLGVMVTIREHVWRRINRIRGVAFVAWLVLFVCGLAYIPKGASELLLIGVVPSIIVFLAALFYLYTSGTRCPKCRGNLGYLLPYLSPKAKTQAKFCPFCGISLDEELPHVANDA